MSDMLKALAYFVLTGKKTGKPPGEKKSGSAKTGKPTSICFRILRIKNNAKEVVRVYKSCGKWNVSTR